MTGELFIGALVGYFANYLLHRVTTLSDELSRRVDELCVQISELADLSTEYWLLPSSDPSVEQLKARIIGKQHWVQSAIDMLTEDIWYLRWSIEDDIIDFMESLTGEDFGSSGRVPDFMKSVSVQGSASQLVFGIRRQRRSVISSWF